MRVLVLGHRGMLGHTVLKYLSSDISIDTVDFRWPSPEFKNYIKNYKGEFIVNCIGAIHQKTDMFDVNWELPIFLDMHSSCRIIHPGTDCEIDDNNYGISKKIARDFIVNTSKRTKSIKTSIIGPEINTKSGLMSWFLSSEESVKGFTNHRWNGNTTLTWAVYALDIMRNWDQFDKETVICSDCISKYSLLHKIKEVFDKKTEIIPFESPNETNRCLTGIYTQPIRDQLVKLKSFYD